MILATAQKMNRSLPALKAPAHASPVRRPGFGFRPPASRPERGAESFRPFRADNIAWGAIPRGV
jgi:hypothetical protein